MPRVRTNPPAPDKNKGQRSIDIPDLPLYLPRIIPNWGSPNWVSASAWRAAVQQQPFAIICRDYLVDNIVSLDWKIEPRDSEKRDELKEQIDYYTRFIYDTGEYDYTEIVEWICKDALDLPFGGACEIGRENDAKDGKVVWIEPLDGGTLFPSFKSDTPYGQYVPEATERPIVYFPRYAISRIYLSPRTELKRKGWGIAPPEKIYLALELINRGDIYYANLLLDTPETGILDLGDMSADSASKWVSSWRNMLAGIDPFKIPVLYEHERPINFIPFVKSPVELMFDKSIIRYSGIVAAGYGITLSDVGFSATASGGDTLAGSIRSERRTRKTGMAVLKKKVKAFFDRILPKDLEFIFIDLDDEVSTAIGRARLASATAFGQLITHKAFTPKETRLQMIADGLINISVPEDIPMEDFPAPPPQLAPFGNNAAAGGNGGGSKAKPDAERPSMLGRPVAPSSGGQGEVRNSLVESLVSVLDDIMLLRMAHDVLDPTIMEIKLAIEVLGTELLPDWEQWHDGVLFGYEYHQEDIPELTKLSLEMSCAKVKDSLLSSNILSFIDKSKFVNNVTDFIRTRVIDWNYVTGKSEARNYFGSWNVKEVFDSLADRLSLEITKEYVGIIRSRVVANAETDFVSITLQDNFLPELRKGYEVACINAVNKFLSDLYDIISKDTGKDINNGKAQETIG